MNIRHLPAGRRITVRGAAAIVAASLVLALAGCSKDADDTNVVSPSISATPVTEDPTETPTTPATVSPEEASGLLPADVQNGPLKQPHGDGNEEFGKEYTMSAFKFAVSFVAQMEKFPAVWDPKKPPTEETFWRFQNMLTGNAAYQWGMASASIVGIETADEMPPTGFMFNALIRPQRQPDGTVAKSDWVSVPPWDQGMTVNEATASSCKPNTSEGQELVGLLCLDFKTVHNMVVGRAPKYAPEQVIPWYRAYTVAVEENPLKDEPGATPFVIAYINVHDESQAQSFPFPK